MFPLFDLLHKQANNNNVDINEKRRIRSSLVSLNNDTREHVFVIILLYWSGKDSIKDKSKLKTRRVRNDEYPYSCKINNAGRYVFNFNEFPNKLLNMLRIFLELNKNEKEDMNVIDFIKR